MKTIFTLIFAVIVFTTGHAKVRLPWFFSDNMVLQQQAHPKIWGWTNNKTTVTIYTSWNKKKHITKPDANGKWETILSTTKAGGPYQISISDGETTTIKNILIGEVWICSGQSNMEMPMKGFKNQPIFNSNDYIFSSDNNEIRLYTIPRSVQTKLLDTSKQSHWKIANPLDVSHFSAVGYLFAKMLYEKLKVPIGVINVSYGGSPIEAFMDEATLRKLDVKIPDFNALKDINNRTYTTLYNGMMHPLIGVMAKGFIWYQGESNANDPDAYEKVFPEFVKMLRTQFGYGEFPFYYVQIAPYNYNGNKKTGNVLLNSAFLRDAQRKSLSVINNSGMVVTMDIGDATNIHPGDKETVAKRLAKLALSNTYDYKGFASTGPLYESMEIKDNTALIKFKNAPNGFTTFGAPMNDFEIAGANRIFYPAKTKITNSGIEVSASEVNVPVAVRYAFTDFAKGSLFNTEGFPASSFRTDDWKDPETKK